MCRLLISTGQIKSWQKLLRKRQNTQRYSIGQVQLAWCDAGFDIMLVQKAGWVDVWYTHAAGHSC